MLRFTLYFNNRKGTPQTDVISLLLCLILVNDILNFSNDFFVLYSRQCSENSLKKVWTKCEYNDNQICIFYT